MPFRSLSFTISDPLYKCLAYRTLLAAGLLTYVGSWWEISTRYFKIFSSEYFLVDDFILSYALFALLLMIVGISVCKRSSAECNVLCRKHLQNGWFTVWPKSHLHFSLYFDVYHATSVLKFKNLWFHIASSVDSGHIMISNSTISESVMIRRPND